MVATAITVGVAAYGANRQRKAGQDVSRGADAATQLQRDMYEQTRSDQMPFIEAGQQNLETLNQLNSGDFSSFTASPDYQFTRDQAIKGLDRSAAQRGTQYSGGQLAALADYSGGLASKTYGDYYNRISQLAGLGQNAAAGVGNAGTTFASQAGDNMIAGANARADARIAQASTYGQLAEQLGGAFGRWRESRNPKVGA
jgi:hypothetical protein